MDNQGATTRATVPAASVLAGNALPAPTTIVTPIDKPVPVPKHFLAAFFLSFFLGVFGADRFYLGRYISGTLKLLTFGGFGIGAIVDLALILNGAMRDARDRPLVGYEQYKGLAKRTIMWVTIGAALFIAVNFVLVFVAIGQAINTYKSSGIGNAIGGSGAQDVDIDSLLSGGSL